MSVITIDFETYYDKDYSLSKMTTEEYINDPRFEVIGVGVKVDDEPTQWVDNDSDIKTVFESIHWEEHAILCHNTLFDGAILSWKYGIKPGMWFDTLSMARAIHGVDAGGSLASLAERYNLGRKGDEVVNAIGKRRVDFFEVDLARYGDYCRNDVDLTCRLFHQLAKGFPDNEYSLIDLTIRMYTEPTLQVNEYLLTTRLEELIKGKQNHLRGLMLQMNATNEEEVRERLSSNPKFAEVLKQLGVDPPMKTSPTTGKQTYAFAKTDEGFLALHEHPDPAVQQVVGVRLGTKSTLEESRIERFIGIGNRNRGALPVPLRYYGAHTGRWSGLDSVNFQNLPSRDKAKKTLKNAIVAPTGHVIINCDSSQIEARVLAWLAGQNDVVEQFRNGEDVYSIFASKIFGRPISKANPVERFVGKTCILGLGYGTGAAKLQQTLKLGGAGVSEEECKRIVDLYRNDNYAIKQLWQECDTALRQMMYGQNSASYSVGQHEVVKIDSTVGIKFPNGLYIRYPNLRVSDEERIIYDSRRGAVSIWGGAVVENIVQALARIVVGQQMLWVAQRYRPVLTVHDAIVLCVPQNELEAALNYVNLCMSTPPPWAIGLPVACEAKHGYTYGDC